MRRCRIPPLAALATSIALGIFANTPSTASVHFVSRNSPSPISPYTNWLTAATSIQDAVEASADSDTVLVTNGVYDTGGAAGYPVGSTLTSRVCVHKPITVLAVSGNPTDTIIQGRGPIGGSAVRGVYLVAGAALSGFTVTSGATLRPVTNLDFTTVAETCGGGVFAAGGDVAISNCTITSNMAYRDAGGVYGGTLRDCVLSSNVAEKGNGGGASTANLSRCTLSLNAAQDGRGGGASGCMLVDCLVLGNYSDEGGGGAYDSTCSGCAFDSNRSDNRGGGAQGGMATDCVFTGNVSVDDGGGVAVATLVHCSVVDNVGDNGGGATESVLLGCLLSGNASADVGGGGAWASSLVDCLLAGNTSQAEGGGAYQSMLTNCTVAGNLASQGGGVSDSILWNTIVYYNMASNGVNHHASTLFSSCSIPDAGTAGNITNEPGFADSGVGYGLDHVPGDYRLLAGSPCINAGANQPWMADASDLDGLPRIIGAAVDMGAYEYPLTESGIPGVWLRDYGLPTDGSADGVDSDGDGLVNHGEYEADTIPTNAASVLRLLAIAPLWGGTRLDWQGGREAWQFLEMRENLADTNESWTAIYGIPPPTPITNAVVDLGATNRWLFYRIRAQR